MTLYSGLSLLMRCLMKKFVAFLVSGIVLLSAISLIANAKIFSAHKAYQGFKAITRCADCHNDETKLEKKKGQDYKGILKTASCAGKGCHKK
jgi:hypothetical protein